MDGCYEVHWDIPLQTAVGRKIEEVVRYVTNWGTDLVGYRFTLIHWRVVQFTHNQNGVVQLVLLPHLLYT